MRNKNILMIVFFILLLSRMALSSIIAHDEVQAMRHDSHGYISLADNMVSHGQYYYGSESTLDLHRTPGYPIFLAMLIWIFGKPLWVVALAQLALSGLTAWIVYLIGRRWLSPSIGLLSGIVLALLPNAAAWSLIVLSETLFTTLIIAGMYFMMEFLEQPRIGKALNIGFFTGAAALVRPIGVVLILVWVGALIWLTPGGKRVWNRIKHSLAFIVVVLIMLLPWMVRNAVVWDTFTLSTISKWNLGYYIVPAILAEDEGITLEEARDRIPVSDTTTSGEAASHIEIILRSPLATVKVLLTSITETLFGYGRTNLSAFWGEPYDIDEAFNLLRQGKLGSWLESLLEPGQLKAFLIMVMLLGTPILIFVCAAAGGIAAWRTGGQEKKTAILYLAPVFALLLPVIGVGNARFLVPIDPFLVLLGALGFYQLREKRVQNKTARSDSNHPG